LDKEIVVDGVLKLGIMIVMRSSWVYIVASSE
jgi:hypothetical protein